MITIYHNPRCSKSREGLQMLEEEGRPYTIIKYLDEPLTKKELTDILHKLQIKPIELVRKNEAVWKENYKNKTLTDSDILDILTENPKLIERPIVVNGDNAVIARPSEKIRTIL